MSGLSGKDSPRNQVTRGTHAMTRPRKPLVLLLFSLLAWPLRSPSGDAATSPAVRFYVAANGRDDWTGRRAQPNAARTDGPFATIDRARDAIRRLKRKGPIPGPVEVLIRGGMYFLDEPFVLTPEDSGTAAAPITYAAYPGEKPVLSGGRPIRGWRKGAGQTWTVHLPDVQAGQWFFRQLFVNGRRAIRARAPNRGYLRVVGLVDVPTGAPWNQGVDRFRFAPGDIRPWHDLTNVELVVFHSWNTSRVRIAEVDEKTNVVRFTGKTIFRPLAWDPQQRYYVENARELLDAPGEWYLDRESGVLTYWPRDGEDWPRAECIAPVLTELVRFDGDPDTGRFVEHVRLEGLSFQHADWTLGPKGYGDPQAAVTIPAAVMADGARHCVIRRCEIAHVGRYGLWFRRGCKHNRIEQNHVHDLGAGGIRLGEPNMAQTDEAESSDNLIANNYIHDGGHVYAAGVGFWLAHAGHNVFEHNEIHSFNYTGISLGWNWNEAPTRTLHNTIRFNRVHHVMRGVLSDGAGLYTLGTQTGTVIRNNVFHDIWPYLGRPAMAWGIYFDQGSNGLTVENNVVYHTLTGGLMGTGKPA
ncbi:MAG TPA: right-handed parallel beta-helix repeat-containing protein, partial [Planctomycetaceae bacterium]|nr:right-handed parallel beta-helix repeat-containing protein [Planctomycetaceae bacterium]